jgi:hypothetical protein
VSGLPLVRELGNLAPYLRYKGCLASCRKVVVPGRSDKGEPTV